MVASICRVPSKSFTRGVDRRETEKKLLSSVVVAFQFSRTSRSRQAVSPSRPSFLSRLAARDSNSRVNPMQWCFGARQSQEHWNEPHMVYVRRCLFRLPRLLSKIHQTHPREQSNGSSWSCQSVGGSSQDHNLQATRRAACTRKRSTTSKHGIAGTLGPWTSSRWSKPWRGTLTSFCSMAVDLVKVAASSTARRSSEVSFTRAALTERSKRAFEWWARMQLARSRVSVPFEDIRKTSLQLLNSLYSDKVHLAAVLILAVGCYLRPTAAFSLPPTQWCRPQHLQVLRTSVGLCLLRMCYLFEPPNTTNLIERL